MSHRPPLSFVAASTPEPTKQNADSDEEEDYMSMIIEEPKTHGETLTQKKLRKQREVRYMKHAPVALSALPIPSCPPAYPRVFT